MLRTQVGTSISVLPNRLNNLNFLLTCTSGLIVFRTKKLFGDSAKGKYYVLRTMYHVLRTMYHVRFTTYYVREDKKDFRCHVKQKSGLIVLIKSFSWLFFRVFWGIFCLLSSLLFGHLKYI